VAPYDRRRYGRRGRGDRGVHLGGCLGGVRVVGLGQAECLSVICKTGGGGILAGQLLELGAPEMASTYPGVLRSSLSDRTRGAKPFSYRLGKGEFGTNFYRAKLPRQTRELTAIFSGTMYLKQGGGTSRVQVKPTVGRECPNIFHSARCRRTQTIGGESGVYRVS